jgi:hypothetical protein
LHQFCGISNARQRESRSLTNGSILHRTYALKNPTAAVTRLAATNRFYIHWPPDKMGNPYKVGPGHHTVDEAVTLYRRDLITGSLPFSIEDVIHELKGRKAEEHWRSC